MMNGNSYHHNNHQNVGDSLFDSNYDSSRSNGDGYATIPTSSSSPSHGPSSPIRANYLEHRVTKMDTLAGVAIKYGVEVADLRRMNGLVMDLQMFALDVLKIPPGRHPPSPIVQNGSPTNWEQTPPPSRRPHDDVLESLQSLKLKPPRRVSPAMSSLQGYYGLGPPKRRGAALEAEMAVYRTGRVLNLEIGQNPKASPATDPGLNRKCRSMLSLDTSEMTSEDKAAAESRGSGGGERFTGGRQNVNTNPLSPTPVTIMKEDSGGGFLGRICKGLALRPKIGSRTDIDAGRQNSITATAGDLLSDVFVSMRKSSSTSNLQETESSTSVRLTSKRASKPDSVARPIFDGFASVRKNKAALD